MPIPVQKMLDFKSPQQDREKRVRTPMDESFPEKAANQLARLESFNKHLYRPNTYLHKWWARRSGTTFRYILKQLVDDGAKRDYYEPGGLEGKIILDPMMGGGTTLHEAIRMGANVIGVDIDPIPVLQVKASLTSSPAISKRKIFEKFFAALRDTLCSLYLTKCPICHKKSHVQFTLYGLRRKCKCREVLFVDSLSIRENSDGLDIRLCDTCGQVYSKIESHCDNPLENQRILTKGQTECPVCHTRFRDVVEESFPQRYRPLVIVGKCGAHGQFFKRLDEADRELLHRAHVMAQNVNFGDLWQFDVPTGPKSDDLRRRNIRSFLALFTPRQLLYLHACVRLLSGFPMSERLWLSLLVSTSLEFNSLLCGYKGTDLRRPGAIRHVFSHHAYSFPYTALENNPVFTEKTSGTLSRLFSDRIVRAGRWAAAPIERRIIDGKVHVLTIGGEVDGGQPVASFEDLKSGTRRFFVSQADSAKISLPDKSVDYVITDPPYYDSVQYSDLSNFFRVWLRALLPDVANWSYDQHASAVFEGVNGKGKQYGEALSRIWKECARVLKKPNGKLIFTFHHWRAEAWAELTISLKRSGFLLMNRHVIFSENPVSVHIRSLRALKHDVILVLGLSTCCREFPEWPQPCRIETRSSSNFCRDCGAALGWSLSSGLGEHEIHTTWKRLLQGQEHGKTSR